MPIKNFRKSSRGCTQGLPKVFRAPIYMYSAHSSALNGTRTTQVTCILFKKTLLKCISGFASVFIGQRCPHRLSVYAYTN